VTRHDIYDLLPAFYRGRDSEQGGPLRALLEIFEKQLIELETDLQQLYENWFIETCPPWVVPYIGDLLGLPNMGAHPEVAARLRPLVGNLLRLRRGKGTLDTLVHAASAVSGWTVRAADYRNRLAMTRHVGHLQAEAATNIDFRATVGMGSLDPSFDHNAHMVDVRIPEDMSVQAPRKENRVVNYHPNRIGLFIWRDSAWPLTRVVCRPRPEHPDRYTFDPAGAYVPLFNQPQMNGAVTCDDPSSVPGPVDSSWLVECLRRHHQAITEGTAEERGTVEDPLPFSIYLGGERVPAQQIRILSLEDWTPRPAPPTDRPLILVDPERGRFCLPRDWSPDVVSVDYVTGSSGRVGAGPHDRRKTLSDPDTQTWFAMVARHLPHRPDGARPTFNDLERALEAWRAAGSMGVIRIMDNGFYTLSEERLVLSGRERLHLEADNGTRPFIDWNTILELREATVSLVLEGLSIIGTLAIEGTVERNSSGRIDLVNCTLVPSARQPSLRIQSLTISRYAALIARMFPFPSESVISELVSLVTSEEHERELMLQVNLTSCISGAIELLSEVTDLSVTDSIVDAAGRNHAIQAHQLEGGEKKSWFEIQGKRFPKPTTYTIMTCARSTFLGHVHVHEMNRADSCIFTEPVSVMQKSGGSFRYSFVPMAKDTPEAVRASLAASYCQPAQALTGVVDAGERATILTQLQPDFIATVHGKPGYCRLGVTTPEEITKGAEDGSEMGVYHGQQQPQVIANLQRILEEYTPFGTEIDIHFVT